MISLHTVFFLYQKRKKTNSFQKTFLSKLPRNLFIPSQRPELGYMAIPKCREYGEVSTLFFRFWEGKREMVMWVRNGYWAATVGSLIWLQNLKKNQEILLKNLNYIIFKNEKIWKCWRCLHGSDKSVLCGSHSIRMGHENWFCHGPYCSPFSSHRWASVICHSSLCLVVFTIWGIFHLFMLSGLLL